MDGRARASVGAQANAATRPGCMTRAWHERICCITELCYADDTARSPREVSATKAPSRARSHSRSRFREVPEVLLLLVALAYRCLLCPYPPQRGHR